SRPAVSSACPPAAARARRRARRRATAVTPGRGAWRGRAAQGEPRGRGVTGAGAAGEPAARGGGGPGGGASVAQNQAGTNTITDTPAANPQSVMSMAGIEAAYADIKSLTAPLASV